MSFLTSFRYGQIRHLRYNQPRLLRRAVDRIREIGGNYPPESWIWTDAIYGFGNEAWSADELYLSQLASESARLVGNILECGSGLSTLVLAAVAERTGSNIIALEQSEEWAGRITKELSTLGLTRAVVHYAPLAVFREGGIEYEWYDTSKIELPDIVRMIVSDGPAFAKHTHAFGGRYGMLPRMRDRLAPGCLILADDANDPKHRPGLEQWAKMLGTALVVQDSTKGYGKLVVPG